MEACDEIYILVRAGLLQLYRVCHAWIRLSQYSLSQHQTLQVHTNRKMFTDGLFPPAGVLSDPLAGVMSVRVRLPRLTCRPCRRLCLVRSLFKR